MRDLEAEAQMAIVMDLVKAIRRLKAQSNITSCVPVYLQLHTAPLTDNSFRYICYLANVTIGSVVYGNSLL